MIRYFPLMLVAGLLLMLFATPRHEQPSERSWSGNALPALYATELGASKPSLVAMGDGLTLINLFASWCTPCLAEHPQLKRLAANGKVTLVGIAWNDTPEAIAAFLGAHGNPYSRTYIDHEGGVAVPLGTRGIPESFLVDGSGRVLYHLRGPLDAGRLERDILPLLGK